MFYFGDKNEVELKKNKNIVKRIILEILTVIIGNIQKRKFYGREKMIKLKMN